MSLFYNPKKRDVPVWVRIVLISIPIIFIILGWFALKKAAEGRKLINMQQERDIFDDIK